MRPAGKYILDLFSLISCRIVFHYSSIDIVLVEQYAHCQMGGLVLCRAGAVWLGPVTP